MGDRMSTIKGLKHDNLMDDYRTKYQIVADNTYDWEFWLSPQGKYVYGSPASKRITGYLTPDFDFIRVNRAYAEADGRSQGFFTGKNHFDLFPNDENQAIFRSVVESGESYTVSAKPFSYGGLAYTVARHDGLGMRHVVVLAHHYDCVLGCCNRRDYFLDSMADFVGKKWHKRTEP